MGKYFVEAHDDAYSTMLEFIASIGDQAAETAGMGRDEISDDIRDHRVYSDSYHHETHVDKSYSLSEAAELLDDLSQYEETDSGLWDSQAPREAISTQAAFTYGNAVASMFDDGIEELNDFLKGLTIPEGMSESKVRKAAAMSWVFIKNFYREEPRLKGKEKTEYGLALQAMRDMEDVPCSFHGMEKLFKKAGQKYVLADVIKAIAEAQVQEPEEDDDSSEG